MRKRKNKLQLARERAAAAVVVYVRCPATGRVFVRPLGNKWRAWFILNVN